MRPPLDGLLIVSQLFGGNPAAEAYVDVHGYRIIGHDGVDFACAIGDLVYPAWYGVVHVVDSGAEGFGLHVLLEDRFSSRYALYGHLSSVLVPDGGSAEPHVAIARAGTSGYSTGPHVHFGLYPRPVDNGYGGAIDPLPDFDLDVWPRLDLSRTNL